MDHGEEDVRLVEDPERLLVCVEHHHLADVVHPHPLDREVQRKVRGEAVVLLLEVPPADEVAEVVVPITLDEPLVGHPVVVEHLRKVLRPVVADEGDDPLRLGLGAAVAEGRLQQGADARPREHAFGAEEFTRGVERVAVFDGDRGVHQ